MLILCLSRGLPLILGAATSPGDLIISPTTFTTYLEGNIEHTTTTEAYPTLYSEADNFGKILQHFYIYLDKIVTIYVVRIRIMNTTIHNNNN